MTFYNSVSSNSISTLFSGFSSSSASNGLSNIMADYYSIRNGSYKKLLTAYYEKYGTDTKESSSTSKYNYNNDYLYNTVSKDSVTKLTTIKSESEELSETATELVTSGKKSLFNTVDVKGEDGSVTKKYDTDKIYKAVSQFVEDYNNVIESTKDSKVSSIVNSRNSMTTTSKINSKVLDSIGITINKDNTLTIDSDKFKSADMSIVKSIFNGSGSYGYSIATQASTMNSAATFEATKTGTYTSSGSYYSSVSSGSLFDSIF